MKKNFMSLSFEKGVIYQAYPVCPCTVQYSLLFFMNHVLLCTAHAYVGTYVQQYNLEIAKL